MYETSHLKKLGCQCVHWRGSKTDRPQEWDKPRRRGRIRCQPIMVTTVRKSSRDKKHKGTRCTLYEARRPASIPNSSRIIENVTKELSKINPMFGFIHMASSDKPDTDYVPTRLGTLVPNGSVLSYQLSVVEANFDVSSIDTSQFCKSPCRDQCELSSTYLLFLCLKKIRQWHQTPFWSM